MIGRINMTVRDIAQDLSISESTVRRAIRDHELEAMRVRGQYRIPHDSYAKYQAECKQKAAQ